MPALNLIGQHQVVSVVTLITLGIDWFSYMLYIARSRLPRMGGGGDVENI